MNRSTFFLLLATIAVAVFGVDAWIAHVTRIEPASAAVPAPPLVTAEARWSPDVAEEPAPLTLPPLVITAPRPKRVASRASPP